MMTMNVEKCFSIFDFSFLCLLLFLYTIFMELDQHWKRKTKKNHIVSNISFVFGFGGWTENNIKNMFLFIVCWPKLLSLTWLFSSPPSLYVFFRASLYVHACVTSDEQLCNHKLRDLCAYFAMIDGRSCRFSLDTFCYSTLLFLF